MSEKKMIDLYLVSGFLGSGKTTFLKNVLEGIDTRRVGVIVNEYGSISIDGKILKDDEDMRLVEINRGSIFCACLKGGFVKTLAAFLQQDIDTLFVEASGMADPCGIEKLLLELEPLLEKKFQTDARYHYCGSICVVDAGHFIALANSILPPVKQVEKSNLVVVNKTDTVTPEGLEKVHAQILKIRPDARIYDTMYAKVPMALLQDCLDGETDFEAVSMNLPTNRPYGAILSLDAACEKDALLSFLKTVSQRIFRMKGFFHDENATYFVSGVANDIQCQVDECEDREYKIVLIGDYAEDMTQWITDTWTDLMACPCPIEED